MSQTKKVPLRKCTGCNEVKNKKDMIRVIRDKEGNISMDATGRKNGRGAYICPDVKCLEKAKGWVRRNQWIRLYLWLV